MASKSKDNRHNVSGKRARERKASERTASGKEDSKENTKHSDRKSMPHRRIANAKAISKRPGYRAMIMASFSEVGKPWTLSRQAILNYIFKNFETNNKRTSNYHFKISLKYCVTNGYLKQIKGKGANGSFALLKNQTNQLPISIHKAAKRKDARLTAKTQMPSSKQNKGTLQKNFARQALTPARKKKHNPSSTPVTFERQSKYSLRGSSKIQRSKSKIKTQERQVSDSGPPRLDKETNNTDAKSSKSHQQSSQSISVGARTCSRSHGEALDSPKPFSDIKAIKKDRFDLHAFLKGKNVFHYWFTGIAVTEDRRILFTLFWDKRIVVFSKQPVMRLLSYITLSEAPRSIAVINNTEAAVSTEKQCIAILDITGPKLKNKNRVKLGFELSGIARHRDKLVVMCSNPIAVKLIDKSGTVYWSVSHDKQGHSLFATPISNGVCCHSDDLSSTVIVCDHHTEALTLLNGDTGAVITRQHVTRQNTVGETSDTTENAYFVCYGNSQQISVFNSNLSKEKVILNAKDGMFPKPVSLTYDNIDRQLFVCYAFSSIFECFDVIKQGHRGRDTH